jgi:hypothetical protein
VHAVSKKLLVMPMMVVIVVVVATLLGCCRDAVVLSLLQPLGRLWAVSVVAAVVLTTIDVNDQCRGG